MTPIALGAVAIAVALYAAGVLRLARRGVRWGRWRSLAFLAGAMAVALASCPPLATHDEDIRIHVLQHLLLGMLAPLLFALSAPVTLLLRALPPRRRAPVVRILHSRLGRVATHPVACATLAVGSLYLLYFTGLYAATLRSEPLHAAVHAHMLITGSMLAWALVGLDPVPHRPALRLRSAALVGALAGHGILAKLLYAHAGSLAGGEASSDAWRQAAQLMWYGGDLVDLGLLIAFFGQWYAAGGRRLERLRTV
jgi:putative membrane protein